jgi:hypothetical protein
MGYQALFSLEGKASYLPGPGSFGTNFVPEESLPSQGGLSGARGASFFLVSLPPARGYYRMPKVAKRSAQVERLEVMGTGRRRRWSEDEKLKIVLESLRALR